jgi:aryl-phospho-beta-D-glucosidase BglC (GH1 family)
MWQRVASYIGKEPNLLGYEMINEPIGSNAYRSIPDTLFPGRSNNKFLFPAYTKIYEGIRSYDP